MDTLLPPEKVVGAVEKKVFRDRQHIPHVGKRVNSEDIMALVDSIFQNKVSHDLQSL